MKSYLYISAFRPGSPDLDQALTAGNLLGFRLRPLIVPEPGSKRAQLM